MAAAESGTVRRLVPHGEDICWLMEALTARGMTGSYDSPYDFFRGPERYAMLGTVQPSAELDPIRAIVRAYNDCFSQGRFLYPGPSGAPLLFNRLPRYVHKTSGHTLFAANGGRENWFWGDWYRYPVDPLDGLHGESPRGVGSGLSYIETMMGHLKWRVGTAINPYPDFGYYDMTVTGSVVDKTEGRMSLPSVSDLDGRGLVRYYRSRGFYVGSLGKNVYYQVKAQAVDSLVVPADKVQFDAVNGWVVNVRPIYRYAYYYEHYDNPEDRSQERIEEFHSGQSFCVADRTYQVAADGTVELRPYSDIGTNGLVQNYGGSLDETVPTRPTREFRCEWSITLVDVELIYEFDDAVCDCESGGS